MSLFDIFKRTSTPEELYKKKKDAEFIESLKEISITVTNGGASLEEVIEDALK